MDAASLGVLVFSSLPSWVKGTVSFTRTGIASYNPISGTTTASAPVVAACECVVQYPSDEAFVPPTAIMGSVILVTVPASKLGSFRPQADDTLTIAGNVFTVDGLLPTAPNGSTAAVYRVKASR